MTTVSLSSGVRKYTPIWQKIKAEGRATIICDRKDTLSIINMVRKERTRDKSRPQGKILKVDITDTGVHFWLETDTSIRNL